MYCTNCGEKINEEQDVCLNCGIMLNNKEKDSFNIKDKGGFLWALLGFLNAIIGLVLYLLLKDTKPNVAKSIGKGALVSVIVYFVLIFVLIIFTLLHVIVIGSI